MKTTKEDILLTSLKLFAARGFDAVSTSMIADELNITKGALYRHFKSKKDIFDSIITKMFELDEKQANDNNVPAKEYAEDVEGYKNTKLTDLCEFVNEQYVFWTENEFAKLFRRMITIEQFKSNEMNKLYQDVIALGPVKYTEDLFNEMINNGQLNKEANDIGVRNLAVMLFSPLQLSIQFYDGGEDSAIIKENLRCITSQFENKWMNKETQNGNSSKSS